MTSFPVSPTRIYPSSPVAEPGTGRHHAETLGDAAVPVTAHVIVPEHLPSGRRLRGIQGHVIRVAYAAAVKGQR